MKIPKILRGTVVMVTCLGLLNAQVVCASGPAMANAGVRDVALRAAGTLEGQVVDVQGAPQAGAPVTALQEGRAVAATRTDQAGRFVLANLSGGVYELRAPSASGVYRVWAPRTAPPAAQQDVLLVSGTGVARGNLGGIGPWGWAFIGLAVAAAVAIPLALDDDDAS